jgi:hypothetical protein
MYIIEDHLSLKFKCYLFLKNYVFTKIINIEAFD